ncbi:L-threonine dehydratase biosynthetic IlvA [Haemophilus influenzae]|nr:L-threonine dehydratase biosynthetic IlvA [Haemophilus influenzae]
MPEQPGSFLKFAYVLGNRAVTEFSYRYADDKRACVFVGVRTTNEQEKADIIADLTKNGFDVEDMSDDDIAKTHVRYLMGGRASNDNERLYTFEFPEQKGALLKFLETLQNRWNISLFHYRAHGADYGNILAGFQIEEREQAEFEQALAQLNYVFEDVTESKSYRYFLR